MDNRPAVEKVDEEVVVGWVDKVFEAMPSCTERCHLMYRAKTRGEAQDCNHDAYADRQHNVVAAHRQLQIDCQCFPQLNRLGESKRVLKKYAKTSLQR